MAPTSCRASGLSMQNTIDSNAGPSATLEEVKRKIDHPTFRSAARRFLLCLSFANLCFLNAWDSIQSQPTEFFWGSQTNITQVAAVALDVLILALVLWIAVSVVLRIGSPTVIRILKGCAFGALLIPVNFVRMDRRVSTLLSQSAPNKLVLAIAALVFAAAGVFLLLRWPRFVARLTRT